MSQYKNRGCTQFKNGNLNIRIEKEDLEEYWNNQVFFLSDLLWHLSCEFVGESFCLSNFEMGHLIYNYYKDCCYIFPWRELETLADGKTVKLYAHKVTDEERNEYKCIFAKD